MQVPRSLELSRVLGTIERHRLVVGEKIDQEQPDVSVVGETSLKVHGKDVRQVEGQSVRFRIHFQHGYVPALVNFDKFGLMPIPEFSTHFVQNKNWNSTKNVHLSGNCYLQADMSTGGYKMLIF